MSEATATNDTNRLIAQEEHGFLFFSSLLNKPVYDANGVLVGRLSDLAVSVASIFPPAVGFVVQRGRWEPFALTGRWADVVDISGPVIRLGVPIRTLTPSKADIPGEILLRETLLDKQIVDVNGAKVVRVNDLHFLKLGPCDLRLVHVDVGTRGLVRRMGWQSGIDGLLRHMVPNARYLSAERLIQWQYVQPVSLDPNAHSIRLSVMQKQISDSTPPTSRRSSPISTRTSARRCFASWIRRSPPTRWPRSRIRASRPSCSRPCRLSTPPTSSRRCRPTRPPIC